MGKLTKKIVKMKKLQKTGDNLSILIPKPWIAECGWSQVTEFILEFLPYRKTIIISENEKNSHIIPI